MYASRTTQFIVGIFGIVGIIEDVKKAVPSAFRKPGDTILFLSAFRGAGYNAKQAIGSSDYAKTVLHELWGTPPPLDLSEEAALHKALEALADKGLLLSASDLSDGGCAVAFAKSSFPRDLGVRISMNIGSTEPFAIKERLFSEIGSSVIATADASEIDEIRALLQQHPGVFVAPLGEVTSGKFEIILDNKTVVDSSIEELKSIWSDSLEEQLAEEVVHA